MFNWLKEWLNPTPYNSTTTFECNAPMPKVKAPKSEEDRLQDQIEHDWLRMNNYDLVNPLVKNFVGRVSKNPNKFKVEFQGRTWLENKTYADLWSIYDKENNKKLFLEKRYTNQFYWNGVGETGFLLQGDAKYVFFQIQDIYEKRKARYAILKMQRGKKSITKLYGEPSC